MQSADREDLDCVPQSASDEPHGRGASHVRHFSDSRSINIPVPPDRAFDPIRRIGGRTGWYYANWLWKIRGFLDELVGGPGIRRGRRDPVRIAAGDFLDCWRVEVYKPGRLLRLTSELNMPGRAWLEFEVTPAGGGSRIRQTATYHPGWWLGKVYWYTVYPFHGLVFAGMIRSIAARAAGDAPVKPG